MLRAILQGKAGRVGSADDQLSWRELFAQREDLLTSVFFSRIPYLSPEGADSVMRLLLPTSDAEGLGELQEIDFWPKLPGGDERRYVEPDVVMHYAEATVLVEVKPPAGGFQNLLQWKAEIEAQLRQETRDSVSPGRTLHFVAVGRNAPKWMDWKAQLEAEFFEEKLTVHALEWRRLRDGVAQLLGGSELRDAAVYRDWLDAFSLYGLHAPVRPFSDLLQICAAPMLRWQGLFDAYAIPSPHALDWTPLSNFSDQSKLGITKWH